MARSLNGSTDQINCGTAWSAYSTACTLSAFIYPTAFTHAYNCVFQVNNTAAAFCQMFVKSTGKMAWYIGMASGASIDPGAATLLTDNWYHCLQRFNPSTGKTETFLNGSSDGATAASTIIAMTGSVTMAVGYDALTANRNFPGRLANIGFWNISLSDGEVLALSRGALPCTIRPQNLISFHPLDGLASPEPDFSGARNNGILTGTAFAAGPPVTMFTPKPPILAPFTTATAAQIYAFNQTGARFSRNITTIGY